MRSNAGMAIRQGDVDLCFAQFAAPVNTFSWLGLGPREVLSEISNCPTLKKKLSVTTTRQETRRPTTRPRCLMDRAHHRSSRHTASSPRPATTPATSCWGSSWPLVRAQPCIKRYSITRGWPDASPRHHTAETLTEWTSRFHPVGGFAHYMPSCRPEIYHDH